MSVSYIIVCICQPQPHRDLFGSWDLVRDDDLKSHPDLRNQNLHLNETPRVLSGTVRFGKHFLTCPFSLGELLNPSVCPRQGLSWVLMSLGACCPHPRGRGRERERRGMSSGGVETSPLNLDMPSSSLLFSKKAEAFTVPSHLLEQTLPAGLLERRDRG